MVLDVGDSSGETMHGELIFGTLAVNIPKECGI
jgi:hypothetical protein